MDIIMKKYHEIIIFENEMMRRAILSLPGRKVIRHWFTEMLIGRWRPSAFSESVFVISRDSISKPSKLSSNPRR